MSHAQNNAMIAAMQAAITTATHAVSVVLTLPWAVLCSDNAKYGVVRGRALLTTRYRAAKQACSTLAMAQMRVKRQSPFPAGTALSMTVLLYPPDGRRRDILNLAKALSDALEGVCYADDSDLSDVRYLRAPLDRVNARAEVSIVSITSAA